MSQSLQYPYTIYLMRLWQDSESESAWRFSLEDPHTNARRGFASLDEMVLFLQQEITKDTRKRHEP
ncbi:MAG: hypothetical protein R6X34_06055 [Chloroflexota bacterium]